MDIFQNKYELYKNNPNVGTAIDLNSNFRSRKEVLEDIIKRRLYKRSKLGKKAQKKYDEEVANKKAIREAESKHVEVEKPKVSLVELKQQRSILSSKISYWRKTKRSESEIAVLEAQLNKIKEQIKNY